MIELLGLLGLIYFPLVLWSEGQETKLRAFYEARTLAQLENYLKERRNRNG